MTHTHASLRLLPLLLPLALVVVPACGQDEPAPTPSASGAVTVEDIVNTNDLAIEDAGAGATKIGDAAAWLEAARAETRQANGYVRAGLAQLDAFASQTTPSAQGTTRLGRPYAVWNADRDGVTYTLVVARTGENRVRYTLTGRKGTEKKALLTGVFAKSAPKRGLGRLHLDLGALQALTGAPAASGRLHVYFANANEAKARRVRYREVRPAELGATGAINHGLDTLHAVGTGGVLRTYAIGDLGAKVDELADLSGVQLAALRVRWSPSGGRADGALFDFSAGAGAARLGEIHECWDGGGLRQAYQSFTAKEDAASTVDVSACGGLAQENGAAAAPAEGVDDADVSAALGAALSIDEADADTTLDAADL